MILPKFLLILPLLASTNADEDIPKHDLYSDRNGQDAIDAANKEALNHVQPIIAKHFNDPLSSGHSLWRINSDPPAFVFAAKTILDPNITDLLKSTGRPSHAAWDAVVNDTDNWNILFPANARKAFDYATHVYFDVEVDPAAVKDFEECKLLPNGQLVSEVLPEPCFLRLKYVMDDLRATHEEFDQSRYGNWHRMKPYWILHALYDQGVPPPPSNLALRPEAEKQRKVIGLLESPEDLCHDVDDFPHVDFKLNFLLSFMFKTPYASLFETMDIKAMEAFTNQLQATESEVEKHAEKAKAARINRIGRRIVDALREGGKSYFFAVSDVDHFHWGERSFLDVVREARFGVELIGPNVELDFAKASE